MRDEGAGHVTTTFELCQPPLAGRPASPGQQGPQGQPPAARKLRGQALGRVIATPEPPVGIGGDEDDACDLRRRHGLTDDSRGPTGQPAKTALLPGCDDAA